MVRLELVFGSKGVPEGQIVMTGVRRNLLMDMVPRSTNPVIELRPARGAFSVCGIPADQPVNARRREFTLSAFVVFPPSWQRLAPPRPAQRVLYEQPAKRRRPRSRPSLSRSRFDGPRWVND